VYEEAAPCNTSAPDQCWGAGTALTAPDWTSENNPDHPICYTRSTGMRLTVRLEITGSDTGDATLRVVGPDGITGEGTFNVPCGTEERWVTITTNPLPNVVKAYTPAGLSWSVKGPGETEFTAVQSTQHRIYVTLAAPTGSEATNRRLNFVCYGAAGAGDVDSAALAIWDQLDNEPPVFDLELGTCPAPCPWSLMVPGNKAQCIHLAILMQHASQVIGIPASIGYVYATTNSYNYSNTWTAFESRDYEYVPGQIRTEYLRYWAGGLNNWEAACVVNAHYYAVKETHSTDTVQVIKDIVCPNDLSTNHQVWTWPVTPGDPDSPVVINTNDQYPAPLPGGCP